LESFTALADYDERIRSAIDAGQHHDQRRAILIELLRHGFGLTVDKIALEHNVKRQGAGAHRPALRRHRLGGQAQAVRPTDRLHLGALTNASCRRPAGVFCRGGRWRR